MNEADKHDAGACKAGCGGCAVELEPVPGGLCGWRFAAAAAGIFLLPLATAIAGAAIAGPGAAAQLLGAIAGLGIGVAAAAVGGRIIRSRDNDNTPSAEEDK